MAIIHNVLTVRAAIKEPLSHYGRILMVGDILMANTAGKPIAMGCPECPIESRNRMGVQISSTFRGGLTPCTVAFSDLKMYTLFGVDSPHFVDK